MANLEYEEGYNHYDRHRDIQIVFKVNAAEKAALDDMLAASGVTNVSDFIRGQIFKAHREMTTYQKEQLAEVRQWRREEDEGLGNPRNPRRA